MLPSKFVSDSGAIFAFRVIDVETYRLRLLLLYHLSIIIIIKKQKNNLGMSTSNKKKQGQKY